MMVSGKHGSTRSFRYYLSFGKYHHVGDASYNNFCVALAFIEEKRGMEE